MPLHAGEFMERTKVDVEESHGGVVVFFDTADGPTWGDFQSSVAARESRLATFMAASELFIGRWQLPLHNGGGDFGILNGRYRDLGLDGLGRIFAG